MRRGPARGFPSCATHWPICNAPAIAWPPEMHFVLASGELGTLALGLVIAAVFGGLIAGTLGIDIGIVIVPVLYHVLALIGVDESLRMHLAVGTSLAAIVPISVLSLMRSRNHADFDRELFRRAAAAVLAGALAACALVPLATG